MGALVPGFDLSMPVHQDLLRRIFYARFAPRLAALGMDPEEIYQAVCCSMVVRDQGSHPFEISKGTRSNYAYLVCRSVCSHAIEKHSRRASVLTLGINEDASLERCQ